MVPCVLFKWLEMLHVVNLNSIYRHIDPRENHMQMRSVAHRWSERCQLTHGKWMVGPGLFHSSFLSSSLSSSPAHSSPSITQVCMNINASRWRAGPGCRSMDFCSASNSSAPLMGSAWLDSIMSRDILWRGCKLSIRPPPPHSFSLSLRFSFSSSIFIFAAVSSSFLVILWPSFTSH